jgi:hypothetical protein
MRPTIAIFLKKEANVTITLLISITMLKKVDAVNSTTVDVVGMAIASSQNQNVRPHVLTENHHHRLQGKKIIKVNCEGNFMANIYRKRFHS